MNSEEQFLNKSFYAHGKFLITGEYLVLDGADAFALPLQFGQSLKIINSVKPTDFFIWESYEFQQKWFTARFAKNDLQIIESNHPETAGQLLQIFHEARKLNPQFLTDKFEYKAVSQLEFKREWGMGSSSTLISNISYWAEINPYILLNNTFGGSGYDIACARNDLPLIYNVNEKETPRLINFLPDFRDRIYFTYLGQKQNTFGEIGEYRKRKISEHFIREITSISRRIGYSTSTEEFISLLKDHDKAISEVLNRQTLHSSVFADFDGYFKNLGAWGGDFALVVSKNKPAYIEAYLKEKQFDVFFPYDKVILPVNL